MPWSKRGLIYCPKGETSWQKHSFMTPTPWLRDSETIRLYGGFRDHEGKSRIGYIDVQASNPKNVLAVSKEPVIDLGKLGMFDDRGMILGDVVEDNTQDQSCLRMYYVGFQNVENAKFYAFSGCALSHDGGESFERYSNIPVMDRSDEGLFIRAIHSALQRDGQWHIWYSTGSGWENINGIEYPQYLIRHTTSDNGLTFSNEGTVCIAPNDSEYRIGRPRVYLLEDGQHLMYITSDTYNKKYQAHAALSNDGIKWQRNNVPLQGFTPSSHGWDSQMVCYPVRLHTTYGTYLFYSGNDMGLTGVGYCIWEDT